MYDLIHASNPILDIGENFVKQTHRNRMNILTSNGVLSFIIPIEKNTERVICLQKIAYKENWPAIHWKAIVSSYKNSPYFEHYEEEIKSIVFQEKEFLVEFNQTIFDWICNQLDIENKLEVSKKYIRENISIDYRSVDYCMKEIHADLRPYKQVFTTKFGFSSNLSILDLLCNKGPEAFMFIQKQKINA